MGVLLDDFRQLLIAASATSLIHVCRPAIAVAHLLSREAGVHHQSFEFFYIAPSYLEAGLSFECNEA